MLAEDASAKLELLIDDLYRDYDVRIQTTMYTIEVSMLYLLYVSSAQPQRLTTVRMRTT